MSSLEMFKSDIEASEELARRFAEIVKGIAAGDDELSPAEVQARAAAKLGYELDVTELEMFAAEAAEVNADELERVAGGLFVPNGGSEGEQCTNNLWSHKVEHCWGTDWGCVTFLWN